MAELRPPLALGTLVKPWGTVQAIARFGGPFGERYYFLIDKHKVVSMMPALMVEPVADTANGSAP